MEASEEMRRGSCVSEGAGNELVGISIMVEVSERNRTASETSW